MDTFGLGKEPELTLSIPLAMLALCLLQNYEKSYCGNGGGLAVSNFTDLLTVEIDYNVLRTKQRKAGPKPHEISVNTRTCVN